MKVYAFRTNNTFVFNVDFGYFGVTVVFVVITNDFILPQDNLPTGLPFCIGILTFDGSIVVTKVVGIIPCIIKEI